jgi:hypothetical protein
MPRPGPPGWRLDARLKTLLCKNIIIMKSKEVKTGSNLAEPCKEGCGSRRAALPTVMMMVMMIMMILRL